MSSCHFPKTASTTMAARRRKAEQSLKSSKNVVNGKILEEKKSSEVKTNEVATLADEHLPPLLLVLVLMACSGLLWVFALRDFLATGRVIAGSWDSAMQMFTKSTVFFDNAKGWKSQQGGLSSIQQVTTDANNMGGLFIRKVGGAASLAVQSQKLIPLLFHPKGAMWNRGHFRPLLITAALSNIMLAIFYGMYMQDFTFAQAEMLPMVFIGVLCFETAVIIYYLCTQKRATRIHSVAMPAGKTPTSVVSRILTRTVLTVSGFRALIAARDLFLPGYILKFIPRDDIYLEWTGAFLHSPPLDSQEAQDQGMTASLFIGEMYLSQFMALNILILCLYKFVSALFIRYGRDANGVIQAKMIWKCQVFGNVLNLLLFRLFAPAALSASLDLRWHLMAFAYETVILGIYGFF